MKCFRKGSYRYYSVHFFLRLRTKEGSARAGGGCPDQIYFLGGGLFGPNLDH